MNLSSRSAVGLPNTTSTAFLHRSKSDAQELNRYRFQRQKIKNNQKNSFELAQINKVNKHQLNCIQNMEQRQSNSIKTVAVNGKFLVFYN